MRLHESEWRFAESDKMVERDCLLFEAGDYPDRGLSVSPTELESIAANSESEVPVRVEHLARSPFDGALGVVTRLRAVGDRLFGTLRLPKESWQFLKRAGAKSLSIAPDMAAKRVSEVSFVCYPRVAAAQVFSDRAEPRAFFESPPIFDESDHSVKERKMVSVRQFAEGLMHYVRGVLGGEPEEFSASGAGDLARLQAERDALATERARGEVEALKRRGLLRASPEAEEMACSLLRVGGASVVQFGADQVPLDRLFARFLEANGPVVPMGELAAAAPDAGGASDRLISLARESARRDGIPYVTAFSRVSAAHPDLARAARNESLNG